MNRPTLVLASGRPRTLAGLRRLAGLAVPSDDLPHEVVSLPFRCAAELFAGLDALPPERLREAMLVLELPPGAAGAWDVTNLREAGLAARLLLSYPEVYCVVLGHPGPLWSALPQAGPAERDLVARHHFAAPGRAAELFDLVRLHARGFRALFDPTGLRSLLKGALFEAVGGERARVYSCLAASRRGHAAAVADEELPFVYLNGYLSYKAGLRAWCVSTEAEYDRLLTAGQGTGRAGPAEFDVLLSDWDLVYPDHPGARTDKPSAGAMPLLLSKPPQRCRSLVLITGFADEQQEELLRGGRGLRAPKPYGGFFDLLALGGWGAGNPLRERYRAVWGGIRAAGRDGGGGGRAPGHSAPFARGEVAGRLLDRARRLGGEGRKDTESWAQVALLCAEAKEVLGGLSRTTSYEALALQNEAEVVAEISFFGALAQSKVADRLADLEQEAAVVQRACGGGRGGAGGDAEARTAQLNCVLRAANTLRRHFSDHQQIEASEECLRKITEYQHRLEWPHLGRGLGRAADWARDTAGGLRRAVAARSPGLSWAVNWYPSFATRAGTSLWRLFWVSAAWVLLFGWVYAALLQSHPPNYGDAAPAPPAPAGLGLWHSCLTFVLQPSVSQIEQDAGPYRALRDCGGYRAALLLETLIAYFHLGLLLSVLYRRVTMRAP